MRRGAVLLALAAAGCIPSEGPTMMPGEDCLGCHSGGEARGWSFAGTVFTREDAAASDGVQGVTVIVTDANGKQVKVRSNEAGNFYSAERLTPPLRAALSRGGQVVEMEDTFQNGSCNTCHSWPPTPAFPEVGRLSAP